MELLEFVAVAGVGKGNGGTDGGGWLRPMGLLLPFVLLNEPRVAAILCLCLCLCCVLCCLCCVWVVLL